jgi:hypothetical protein
MAHARRLPTLALLAALLACSSNSRDDDEPAGLGSGAATGSGGSGADGGTTAATGGGAAVSGTGAVIGVAGTTSGETGGTGGIDACVGEKSTGELVPVDLFVMLDISGSMTDLTEDGTDKWTRVKEALTAFLTDEESAGLGVGIQYFPLTKAGVPSTCTSNEQCGDSGPCFLKLCWRAFQELGVFACEEDAECEAGPTPADDYGPCVSYGRCANDETFVCPNPGEECVSAEPTADLGACLPPVSACLDGYECGVESYAAAAVEIAALPDAASALLASIDSQMPNGQTPTGPALAGAIQHVQAFAAQNPEHTVAVLFATDGLPTQCEPQAIAPIADLAAAGLAASPSVRTFVIGVFGPLDVDAPANLDSIALAGGTESAFMIDTSGDVATQFLQALSVIRGTQLKCEFQIPAPEAGQELDYGLVNVVYTHDGEAARLARVADAGACGSEGGWYYDDESAPSRIVVCPSDCARFQSDAGGSVEIELGCTTTIR